MDTLEIILGITAGLALFLYGVTRLSFGLKKIAGDRMKRILERFTQNVLVAILSGTVVTMLLDSSSVTIIMVIALVNAGLVSFPRAIGVIMGANIGTTLSSQLFAFQIDEYSAILLIVGFFIYFVTKRKTMKYVGLLLFGFGLIFFGLGLMGHAVEPLKESDQFTHWLSSLENPWKGVLFGGLITLIIQSSSATMGIVITLANQDMISLAVGVSIMLGAEIGTCADTLMASLGRSRDALRAGVFHVAFNIISVLIGILLYRSLAELAVWISPGQNHARQIANAHVLFNVGGVLLFAWFTRPIARLLERIIPDKIGRTARAATG
ncbi:Na/Pi symporter [Fulvivirgaceae bacterium PWU5]|uniref:Na/Pi symporter n=1 Tax=Dawidia cretensis TaxID=2782350 RepID=A0AAP2GPZ4_9BACT|nr:Na/Pi symporter [Dawidia cretensis]MBT1708749.1 Na/Pi symporter [Dawidia cretensis]